MPSSHSRLCHVANTVYGFAGQLVFVHNVLLADAVMNIILNVQASGGALSSESVSAAALDEPSSLTAFCVQQELVKVATSETPALYAHHAIL